MEARVTKWMALLYNNPEGNCPHRSNPVPVCSQELVKNLLLPDYPVSLKLVLFLPS